MKLISTLLSALLLVVGIHFSHAQSVIINENFDSVVMPNMPSNWSSSNVAGSSWRTDSTNSSNGYGTASAINNMMIRNTDPSGTYTLTSALYNTIGFKDIKLLWSSRVSINYLVAGSTLPVVEYSYNGGASWTPITYIENSANSVWSEVNGGTAIALPSNAANVTNLQFRWTVSIVNNPDGTYRLDDLVLKGTPQGASGLDDGIEKSDITLSPNPSSDMIQIASSGSSDLMYNFSIYDITGKVVKSFGHIHLPYQFSCSQFVKGIYFARMNDMNGLSQGTTTFEVR